MSENRGIVIVPIQLEHADSFHACLDVVAREKRFLALTSAPSLERVRDFVRENVASNGAQFVALDANIVVGWADVLPGWADAIAHCGRFGIGLLPEYRGQGLGERLLQASIAKAQQNGLTRIELEVRIDNERAIRLYERQGFVRECVKKNAMRFDGVYYDALQMALLAEPG